jgi:ATP-dependent protease HslVU (ClpYQ) peptidase subunit
MTTIAYKAGVMAGDKMASEGNSKVGVTTKIFKRNGHLVGFSGRSDTAHLLLWWFERGAKEEEWPDPYDDDTDCSMIVVTPDGKVLFYERFPIPIRMENEFCAIGSGRDFALAAMELGCDPEKAVEVACRLDAYSGNGIDVLCLDAKAN